MKGKKPAGVKDLDYVYDCGGLQPITLISEKEGK
jgi:hypothetical protein